MRAYSYRAYNAAGKITSGSLEADNLDVLEDRLRAAGIWLLEAQEGAGERRVVVNRVRVRRADLIGVFVQLTLLLRAGITLPNALQRLALDSAGTKAGLVLETLMQQVSIGVPLNRAMAEFPRVFTPEITAVVPMVATAVCARVLSARTPAALSHTLKLVFMINSSYTFLFSSKS